MLTVIARPLSLAVFSGILMIASFGMIAQPAAAATRSGTYAVALATPLPAAKRDIIEGVLWRCEGDRCLAPANGERVQSLCAKVARKFGPLTQFAGPQGSFTPEDLARCNGK